MNPPGRGAHDALAPQVQALLLKGWPKQRIAEHLGIPRTTVRRLIERFALVENDAMAALTGEPIVDDVEAGGRREVSVRLPRFVETIDEAIAAAKIDLDAWEITSQETRHYPIQTTRGAVQGTYIKLRLAARTGPTTAAMVDALVQGAIASRTAAPWTPPRAVATTGRLGLLVINDVHFGKLCWGGTTGEANWDLRIAEHTLRAATGHLLAMLPPCERITVALLGDVCHYDTLSGTTTGGTTMDRDSRVAKMLRVAADTVTWCIRQAAQHAPVDVVLVPGNHDAVLTLALQRVLVAEFRGSERVTVDDTFQRRKPMLWGKTLLQFDHGDKARKKLAHKLPQEHPVLWGQSVYREIHTGHLHSDGEVWNAADVEEGVIVRTHPALCPSDQWHFDEGYTGSPRAMQAFVYHADGGLEAVLRYDPRLHPPLEVAA